MNLEDVKIGMLIELPDSSDRAGLIGIVERKTNPGETDYPEDFWIQFDSGERMPYSPWEFEALSLSTIEKRIATLTALKERALKT